MSPDIPLKIVEWFFQYGLIGFLLGLISLYATFRGWHYYKLLSGDSEKHRAVFDEAKELIGSEYWGTRYRVFLQRVLANFTNIIGDHYRFPIEKPTFREGDSELEKLRNPDTLRRVFGVNPFTVESYQFCFKLAFLYPILSFTLGWAMGGNDVFGDLNVMPPEVSVFDRWAVFITLFCLVIFLSLPRGFYQNYRGNFLINFGAITSLFAIGNEYTSFVVSAVLAFLVMSVFVPTFLPTIIFLPAIIGVSLGGANVVADSILICGVLIVVFLASWSYFKAKHTGNLSLFFQVSWLVLFVGSFFILDWVEYDATILTLLFFVIIPLVNAPLDWVSLCITRALLQSIRFNHHRMAKALVWSVLDLGLAFLALLFVSGATVIVVSLVNLVSAKAIVDLRELFVSLSSLENWRDNLWIYFMLLSTLIPTAVHFSLAGGALTLAVSHKKRMETLKDIETNDLSAKRAWIYVSIMPAFGFVLAPSLLFYSLYIALHAHGAWLGESLLVWVRMLASLVDPSLG